jgi:hypothetical protein
MPRPAAIGLALAAPAFAVAGRGYVLTTGWRFAA